MQWGKIILVGLTKKNKLQNDKIEGISTRKIKLRLKQKNKIMKLRNSIFLFALVLLSCNSNAVFEDYKSFENHSWNADSLVVFNFAITDTISRNQVVIKVRHTVDYEFQNLFLFVKAEQTDTVELMLADKSGEWLGKGIGDIREVEFIYQNEKIFHKQGKYTLELEQAMRYGALEKIQHLNNIEAIGFCVEKQNE